MRKPSPVLASLSVLLTLFAIPAIAGAAPLAVTNSGFEDITGETPVNEFTFGALPGWGLYDPDNVTSDGDGPDYYIGTLTPTAPTFFIAGAPEGSRVGIAFNRASTGNGGEYGMQQTLAATLQANTTYTLNVQIGNIASGTATSNEFFNLDGFPGYRIDLMAGTTVLASDNNTLGGSIAEGTFGLSSFNFTPDGSHALLLNQNLGIRLVNLNVVDAGFPAADLEVDFDDVSLDAQAVPEPSVGTSLALAGFALWLVSARRFRAPRLIPVRVVFPRRT
jgi:hapalindole H/12-epi-hapalindole U/12-epi-fischerindole U synthase